MPLGDPNFPPSLNKEYVIKKCIIFLGESGGSPSGTLLRYTSAKYSIVKYKGIPKINKNQQKKKNIEDKKIKEYKRN